MAAEVHAIVSAMKPLITWTCASALQESREACGGHGYLKGKLNFSCEFHFNHLFTCYFYVNCFLNLFLCVGIFSCHAGYYES